MAKIVLFSFWNAAMRICCKDLSRPSGDTITTKGDEKVLTWVKIICTKVRGQADVCKCLLNCDCGREISYSEYILLDVDVRGLVDSEFNLIYWVIPT